MIATFKAMSSEENSVILTEMTGVEVEEGKAEEEEGEEGNI